MQSGVVLPVYQPHRSFSLNALPSTSTRVWYLSEMRTTPQLSELEFNFVHQHSDSDSEDAQSLSPDSAVSGSGSELGCQVSRRLGTVWRGADGPRQGRSPSAKVPQHVLSRIGRLWRESTVKGQERTGPDDQSPSESDMDLLLTNTRDGFTDPRNGDDANCLNCFAAYSGVEFWTIDMRLTLLWCLAYKARFRRHGPALELWLAVIEGSREGVDWGMWEEGDELWLRSKILQRRMSNRFRVTSSRLSSADWNLARETLARRIHRPRIVNPLKNWSTEQRVLRIAWCAVVDDSMERQQHLIKPVDSWTYFTCPLRSFDEQEMKPRVQHQPGCSLSSCKVGVWQWFRTAILDYYDIAQIRAVFGCCNNCVFRAFSEIDGSPCSADEEPAIWPVILWVAFKMQTKDSLEPKGISDFLAIIEAKSKEHLTLWSWDDNDEQTLRQYLVSPGDPGSSWIDRYPPPWRQYLLLLRSNDWAYLEALTRQSSRSRLSPSEYDIAIRIGALVLWISSNAILDARTINIILTFDTFLPANHNRGFLRCLLKRRVATRANHYELNLGPEIVDWHHPRVWLDHNRVELRSTVLHDPDTMPLVHTAENVYMVYHLAPSLPLRFISTAFSCLLKKSGHEKRLNDFRICINLWRKWDTKTCLINFRSVLAHTLEFSKLIEDKDLPKSIINVVIHTDIRCVCAQIADVLRDPGAYRDFLKTENDDAQKLLDLLQDLLDYPLLDARIRPVILNALLKLSTRAGQHPRCFALSDLQLDTHPVAAGSFGDVYKGLIHGETVSVKVMRIYQEDDVEALLKEFYHEALIWRQLSHPNLLPFFGVYYLEDTKRRLCLVSPWMENGDIARYLRSNPVDANRLALVLDVALGLEHLHSLKLVHGDLKAINVLVTRSGRAVLADFGISSVTDSKILQLSTSTIKSGGTLRWQAPELFSGGRNSFASDIYAFSCVCYEILTGSLPFPDLTDVAVMYQVMHGHRPARSSKISDEVWNLMTDCWQTEPEQRPSAEEIVFRLRDLPIGAVPTNAASDWDPWYTSKFRSSLEEHTLFLSCGKMEDWLQFTQPEQSGGIRSSQPIFSARSAIHSEGSVKVLKGDTRRYGFVGQVELLARTALPVQ